MDAFQLLTLLIALLGVFFSVVSLVRTRKLNTQQLRLQEKQEELTDLQLQLLRNEVATQVPAATAPAADVRVSLEGFSSDRKLVITNWGHGPATDIDLKITPKGDKQSPVIESEFREKIPIRELAPGGQCALLTAFSMGTATSLDATWNWKNKDGSAEERSTLLTLV